MGLQETLLPQPLTIQQPGVEGRAARGAVGRTGAVGGSKGQQLPNANAMATEEVKPIEGSLAKAAATTLTGQGGGVQQHPGMAVGLIHEAGSR